MSSAVVCVPCWNQVEYTRWFVESVLRNSGEHSIHFIMLDNGSSDETPQYLHELRQKLKHSWAHRMPVGMTVISRPTNEGVNPAWNLLLTEAMVSHPDADAICLSNNDIVVGPGWLDGVCDTFYDPDNKSYLHANGQLTDHANFENDVRTMLPRVRNRRESARAGWCLFFEPKMLREFLPIPRELTLWFGDDWIHHKLEQAGYKCEVQLNCFALHFLSKSIEEYPNKVEVVARDREIFRAIIGDEAFNKLYRS